VGVLALEMGCSTLKKGEKKKEDTPYPFNRWLQVCRLLSACLFSCKEEEGVHVHHFIG
jgi:hypothetical protein